MNNEELKLQQIKSNLTEDELLELKYMYALGMKWIAKDDNGDVFLYNNKPNRNGVIWMLYACNHTDYVEAMLGFYGWLTWEDEPIEIEKLIK